jgi:hypothetical protein
MTIMRSKVLVPVINAETGEKIGEASEAQMVGAHMNGNFSPILNLKGREYKANYLEDRIVVYPSQSPY